MVPTIKQDASCLLESLSYLKLKDHTRIALSLPLACVNFYGMQIKEYKY
jgi:hypothetical protein